MEPDEIPKPVQLESNQTIIVDDAVAERKLKAPIPTMLRAKLLREATING